ncbi:MAG: hypothetical protein PHQ75_07615 [Thermoguttaceae bacterium]|nr:hypothetical protein [Thermoguttaceae bacterium]
MTRRKVDAFNRVVDTLADIPIDLNPHQIDAAVVALNLVVFDDAQLLKNTWKHGGFGVTVGFCLFSQDTHDGGSATEFAHGTLDSYAVYRSGSVSQCRGLL